MKLQNITEWVSKKKVSEGYPNLPFARVIYKGTTYEVGDTDSGQVSLYDIGEDEEPVMWIDYDEYLKFGVKESKTKTQKIDEADVNDEDGFRDYAENLLKKAHGDDYDEDKATKTIDGLIKKYKEDWGAMIGALQTGLAEAKKTVKENRVNEDKTPMPDFVKQTISSLLRANLDPKAVYGFEDYNNYAMILTGNYMTASRIKDVLQLNGYAATARDFKGSYIVTFDFDKDGIEDYLPSFGDSSRM